MKQLIMFLALLFLAHSTLSAAELKGRVRDAETGESLPGANVYLARLIHEFAKKFHNFIFYK